MAQRPPWIPPIPAAALERLRLALRRKTPSDGLGIHLRRKQGQSLEFREFRPYQMGDDIRHIDWVVSARRPRMQPSDLLVRSFEAEEKMCLAVVLDLRPAMSLPNAAPKLLVALWWMLALVRIAAAQGDDILLGSIFGPQDGCPVKLRGQRAVAVAEALAGRIWQARDQGDASATPRAVTQALGAALKPASAVVVISDMLFEDADGAVARLARTAQAARRELLVIELDSFASELAQPGMGAPLLRAAFEGRPAAEKAGPLETAVQDEARRAMQTFVEARRKQWQAGGLYWPPARQLAATQKAMAEDFTTSFPRDPVLRALLARGTP